jgi:hypothetical protein
MPSSPSSNEPGASAAAGPRPAWQVWALRIMLWGGGTLLAGALSVAMLLAVALAVAYPNLPDISDLSDYRPKLPLRVFSSDGVLLGEFGEERRNLTPIKDMLLFPWGGGLPGRDPRRPGQRRAPEEPGRVHHHHAGGAQCVPVV